MDAEALLIKKKKIIVALVEGIYDGLPSREAGKTLGAWLGFVVDCKRTHGGGGGGVL